MASAAAPSPAPVEESSQLALQTECEKIGTTSTSPEQLSTMVENAIIPANGTPLDSEDGRLSDRSGIIPAISQPEYEDRLIE